MTGFSFWGKGGISFPIKSGFRIISQALQTGALFVIRELGHGNGRKSTEMDGNLERSIVLGLRSKQRNTIPNP